jgi:FtsP/CotA-like multicopper oxidase with cupredoxin domain
MGTVTIARVKFSNHYGKPFPFDVAKSKYVWHCHILEHEDNAMMRYFCLEWLQLLQLAL